ncbi:uncharacterized protein LOC106354899 [Brassica napus]|uniref:uncharacterized protein LOC106354899 n=1 Tax=Brassica napus TaxID=3708 RepID=UPI0006AA9885|nr:uncharacterized protein LOC106354899 [Brassica napus]
MASEESESSVMPVLDPSNVQGKHSSYVKAVTNGPSLSEHAFDMEMVEGKEVVKVPDAVIQDTIPLWDDLLEGRFLAPAPHVAKIHVIVNKIWPLGNQSIKIDVFPVNEVTVKFRIKDLATRKRVLRRGMWNIANIPMVLSKWSPVVEVDEEEEIKVIPMWITMKNVPHRMFSWKGLGFIASAVGKPKRLHPDTILCTSFEEAKVFVEADMTKELPKSHRFKSKLGVDAEVEFIYPWLPDKCTICSKWGHTHRACKSKVKILTRQNTSAKESVVPVQSANMENSQASTKENTEKEETEEFTTRNVTKGKTDRDMEAEVISESPAAETSAPVQTRVVEENTEGVWKDVSPSKHGRLGVKLGVQHTNVISPSRFAVLQEEGKNDVREGQDETGEKKEKEENEKEEGEITEEKKDKEGNEKDDGEMLEALTNTLEEVSEEISGEVSGDETGTDELLNQNIGKAGKSERVECPLRPSVPRLSKTQIRSSKKMAALSTKEGLPSAVGKKRSQKKK